MTRRLASLLSGVSIVRDSAFQQDERQPSSLLEETSAEQFGGVHTDAHSSRCSSSQAVLWSQVFRVVGRKKRGQGWKTTTADEITWTGTFEDLPIVVVSRVRLTGGNMDQFVRNSGARIGANDWTLAGGHYVDLRVLSKTPLDDSQLQRLGHLAATQDHRPMTVRRWKERLSDATSGSGLLLPGG
jgi:hypothetical protein